MGSVLATMLLQDRDSGAGIVGMLFGGGFMIFILALMVFMIATMWKVFTKAGKPGWAILIPIYNLIVLLEIAGKPLWWIILCIIPLVNIVPLIMVPIGIAKNFGKSVGFGIGLLFLGFIFYPVLAWSDAQYQG